MWEIPPKLVAQLERLLATKGGGKPKVDNMSWISYPTCRRLPHAKPASTSRLVIKVLILLIFIQSQRLQPFSLTSGIISCTLLSVLELSRLCTLFVLQNAFKLILYHLLTKFIGGQPFNTNLCLFTSSLEIVVGLTWTVAQLLSVCTCGDSLVCIAIAEQERRIAVIRRPK